MVPLNETYDYAEAAICIEASSSGNSLLLTLIDVFDWNNGIDEPDNYIVTLQINYKNASKNFDCFHELKYREVDEITITSNRREYFNFLPDDFNKLASIESIYLKMAGELIIQLDVDTVKSEKIKIIKS